MGRLRRSGADASAPASQLAGLSALSYASGARDSSAGGGISPLSATGTNQSPLAGGNAAVWVEGFGGWSRFEPGAFGATELTGDSSGFLGGVDVTVDDLWSVGIAGGYAKTSLSSTGAAAEVDSYTVAIYGGRRFGNASLRLGTAYSWHDISTSRAVGVRSFSDTPSSQYDAQTGQIFGEIGYDVMAGPMVVEPFAGLAYVDTTTDGFAERGGAAALEGESSADGTTFSTLGVRLAAERRLDDDRSLEVHGLVGWRHVLGDNTPTARLSFADGGQPFVVGGAPIAKDSLMAQVRVGVRLRERVSLGVSYTGELANESWAHSVKGQLSVRF